MIKREILFVYCALISSLLCLGVPFGARSETLFCTENHGGDVVIMIDKSASSQNGILAKEKMAAKKLLDLFLANAGPNPMVAVGKFTCPDGDCSKTTIKKSLTLDYDLLKSTISSISDPKGFTNLAKAIKVAQAELDANSDPETPNFIVLFSDGKANRPGSKDCPTKEAKDAAKSAAQKAKDKGTVIIGVYPGGKSDGCPGEPQSSKKFLEQEISSPGLFFDGTENLNAMFLNVGDAITCNDNDPCTIDTCNQETGLCEFEVNTTDSDQDGVPDCLDQCQGADDSQLGALCSAGVGECENEGVLVCDNGDIVCSAKAGTPGIEECNALDDDCDGLIDEDFNVGDICEVGEGACKSMGTYMCAIDGTQTCSAQPGTPTQEICDNIDNDCDGAVDEDFNLGNACTVGTGACEQAGVLVCSANGGVECSAEPGSPSNEICDGIDNDCDGEIDEGFNLGQKCTVGVGACQNVGEFVCSENGGVVCSAISGSPSQEICDGIDNDCDGTIDEGFNIGDACEVGVGECKNTGSFVCAGDGTVECSVEPLQPSAEICDGKDNDCDGEIDEEGLCGCVEVNQETENDMLDLVAHEIFNLSVSISNKVVNKAKKKLKKAKKKKASKKKKKKLKAKFLKAKKVQKEFLKQEEDLWMEIWDIANEDLIDTLIVCETIPENCVATQSGAFVDKIIEDTETMVSLLFEYANKEATSVSSVFVESVLNKALELQGVSKTIASQIEKESVLCSQ